MRTRGLVVVDLVEEPVALVEALAQALDPRELRQRLRAQGPEARLGGVEVVEVPVAGGAGPSAAGRGEVLVVAEGAPHFQPTEANARTSTPFATAMPAR